MGVHLTYEFPIFKILEQDPYLLAASDNLFDAVLLTAYWAIQRKRGLITEEDLLDLKLDLMRRLLSKNVGKRKIRRLFDFINMYVRFEKPEVVATFERQFDELVKIEKNMGITEILIRQAKDESRQQGIEQGIVKGRQEVLTEAEQKIRSDRKNTVSQMRLNGFSAESITNILNYSLDDVLTFFKELDAEK